MRITRKNGIKTIPWGGNRRFLCPPSQNLDFFLGIICHTSLMHAMSLLVGNELGDAEDIDRTAKPQGTFTPSISVISSTGVSDFRVCDIDFSIESPCLTGLLGMGILDEINSGFNNENACKHPAGSGTLPPKAQEHCRQRLRNTLPPTLQPSFFQWTPKRRSREKQRLGWTDS